MRIRKRGLPSRVLNDSAASGSTNNTFLNIWDVSDTLSYSRATEQSIKMLTMQKEAKAIHFNLLSTKLDVWFNDPFCTAQ